MESAGDAAISGNGACSLSAGGTGILMKDAGTDPARTRTIRSRTPTLRGRSFLVTACTGAANVSLALVDAFNHSIIETLWSSPALDQYSFDAFKGYSPPVSSGTVAPSQDAWPVEYVGWPVEYAP